MSRKEARGSYCVDELPRVAWHISTKSDNGGASCVEAGPLRDSSGRVAVRHSHHPDGQVIVYGGGQWDAFVSRVKSGHLDFPG